MVVIVNTRVRVKDLVTYLCGLQRSYLRKIWTKLVELVFGFGKVRKATLLCSSVPVFGSIEYGCGKVV